MEKNYHYRKWPLMFVEQENIRNDTNKRKTILKSPKYGME
jgi:hypothetical protein